MENYGSNTKWKSTWKWLAFLLPLSILTSDWLAFHYFLLLGGGSTLIGTILVKEGRAWIPFTTAFLISLIITIISYDILKKTGVSDILPKLLGQIN